MVNENEEARLARRCMSKISSGIDVSKVVARVLSAEGIEDGEGWTSLHSLKISKRARSI